MRIFRFGPIEDKIEEHGLRPAFLQDIEKYITTSDQLTILPILESIYDFIDRFFQKNYGI